MKEVYSKVLICLYFVFSSIFFGIFFGFLFQFLLFIKVMVVVVVVKVVMRGVSSESEFVTTVVCQTQIAGNCHMIR